MEKNKSIDIETIGYIERPSRKLMKGMIIKVSDPFTNHIECIEIVGDSCDKQKLILTLFNYHTEEKETLVLSFSLFIKNKPTNKNSEFPS